MNFLAFLRSAAKRTDNVLPWVFSRSYSYGYAKIATQVTKKTTPQLACVFCSTWPPFGQQPNALNSRILSDSITLLLEKGRSNTGLFARKLLKQSRCAYWWLSGAKSAENRYTINEHNSRRINLMKHQRRGPLRFYTGNRSAEKLLGKNGKQIL
jgi:hypothetical protein